MTCIIDSALRYREESAKRRLERWLKRYVRSSASFRKPAPACVERTWLVYSKVFLLTIWTRWFGVVTARWYQRSCSTTDTLKLLSHIDALADAQGTYMVVRHTAKYVGCKFISRSLIGTIRSCAFICVKGRKKFWTCSKIIFATNAQAYSFIVRWLYGPYVNRSLLGRSL